MHIEISDQHEDDFLRSVVSVFLTRDDGRKLTWKLPRRLMQREGMTYIVAEEMTAEMTEVWG